jgi:hypothetical protein
MRPSTKSRVAHLLVVEKQRTLVVEKQRTLVVENRL